MAGNVAEWVEDEACPAGLSPRRCGDPRRVARGGGWSYLGEDYTTESEDWVEATARWDHLGLRLARTQR